MCCRDVVTGAKVIGYIHVIAASITILLLFIGLFIVPQLTEIAVNILKEDYYSAEEVKKIEETTESMCWAVIIVGIIVSIISLVFASLLLKGIYKRKPIYILSYFIFGVVLNALNALLTLVLIIEQTRGSFSGVLQVAIYSLCLWVVWRAYQKIKMEDQGVLYTNDRSGTANRMPPSYPHGTK